MLRPKGLGGFGSQRAFLGGGCWCLAELQRISCICAALVAGECSGAGCWPVSGPVRGLVSALETREMPPKTGLGLDDAELSFSSEMVNGAGLPGPKMGACWRQVSGCGLTQAVVRLECPMKRLNIMQLLL